MVANGDRLLKQIEYQGLNKLVVGNDQKLDITHLSNTCPPSLSASVKLNNVLIVPHISKNSLIISQLKRTIILLLNLVLIILPTKKKFSTNYCLLKDNMG